MSALAAGAGWLPLLAELAAKATVVLLLAAGAAALLRGASAAARHLAWCVGVAGVLALPFLAAALPAWELPVLPGTVPSDAPAAVVAEGPAGQAAAAPLPSGGAYLGETPAGATVAEVALALLLAGALAGVVWLALGFWGAARVGRRAEVVRDPEWIRLAQETAEGLGLRRPVLLLRSRGAAMPATWGLLWPSVVLPSTADGWPETLRRAVLAHELAHVKRFDCLTQALAQLACVAFWWHPGVWYAARRLRVERERACDDLVLRLGARASDYAQQLLEIARAHRTQRLAAPALVSMAKPSHLESRLLWVLDGARPRTSPSAAVRLAALAAALLVVVPLAAMRPTSAPPAAGVAPAPQEAAPAAAASEAEREPPAPPAWIGGAPDGVPEAPLPPVPADTPRDRRRGTEAEREIDRLVAMRAVGVTPAFVEEMRGAGLGALDAEQLVGLRAVGVDARYVEEMRRAGFTALTAESVSGLRAVGVTPAYLDELRRHGVVPRSAEEATSLRAVGVTGAYVEQIRPVVSGRFDVEALSSMRAVGVTPAYVREMESVGLRGLTAAQLAELRALGVTAAYVREMEDAGLGPLAREQLVRLRASGVDRDLLRSRTRSAPPR